MYDGNKSIIAAALLSTLVNLSAGAGPSLNPQLEYQPAEVENSPASGSDRNQPNLTSYTPTGWDLPIVPSSVPGTNTLNTLYGSRDTFVDWAVINDGNEDITQTFSTALLIDDSLYVYWNSASLQSGWYCYIEDYVTFLSDGAHELKLVADYFDDITEASESDNECTYGFYWQTPTQHVPDPNFKAAINDKLGKPVWYDPTIADLNALTGILWAIWVDDIYSISGAQYLIHLDDLRLQDNQIYNLSPISGLTNLEELYLSRNQIINIYPVSGLVNLTHLYLEDNDITDITAVSGLTNLNYLNLESNQISSIAAVSGLENLYRLQLSENQIADISAVSNLTNLSELYLSHNQISDISATAGLTNLTYLQLASNQITDITAIPNLINLTDLFLSNNHIIDIPAFPEMMSLEELHLSHNEILDISALSSVASLSYIFLDGNQINDISAISSLLNLRRLYIYGNRITDIYPLVENIEFGASDRLYLESEEQSNPLSLEAVMVHITLLQSRGFWALEYPEIPDLNAPCYPDPARNQIGFIASNNLQWRGNFPFREVVYDVWLSESSDNLINVGTGTAFDDTLYYFTPVLDPYTEYWWKIRAVTEGDTLWSGLWHFTTGDDDGFFADFMADQTIAVVGSEVQFTDLSHGNPTSWNWDFESDGIVDATNQNPTWIYNEAGIYSVSLEIYDDRNYDMETKTDYITVLPISPEIEVTPTELEVILFTGTATTENLIIHNVGTEDLIWQAEVDIALERDETPLNGSDYYPDPGLDKGEVDPRRGVPVDRDSGGPDGFGHYWKDSNDENGPVYSWDDISTTGIPVTEWTSIGGFPVMDEGYAGPIDVGFDFPFYDQTYSSLYLSTNGFIEFDLTTAFSWTNQPIPSSMVPNNMIAPFWDDLYGGYSGEVIYKNEVDRFILQYTHWQVLNYGSSNLNFQVHLLADGSIDLFYETMYGPLYSATVGIENRDGQDGLLIAFNTAYIEDFLAVRIHLPWLSLSAHEGTTPPGGNSEIEVHFDAANLPVGDYSAQLVVCSNDLDEPEMQIPVGLTVTDSLQPPVNIFIEIDDTDLLVSWDQVPGAISYVVFGSENPYGSFEQVSGSQSEFTYLGDRVVWAQARDAEMEFYYVVASTEAY